MREKIVIVDDDTETRKLLIQSLLECGYDAIGYAQCGQALVSFIHSQDPDLIILDLSMPGADGLNLCAELRNFCDKPVLCTSQHTEDDLRIEALNRGADEFIAKPSSFEVWLARIRAHLRRYKRAFPVNQRHLIVYPGLQIDPTTHSVIAYGKEVSLSSKEFQLLIVLAKNPNRVFHIETLYDLIWKDIKHGDVRTVMVHIYNLRQKIEKIPSEPLYILTVRGAGYKFNGSVSLLIESMDA
ncbi:response regulator transcription factor [Paenibacillus zeisoli]|uniref:Response regulator transcription factor n=1 Tax=Paenibacillus zeisoli TaxID=2496267 RepID=A0A433XQE2_9BACL|nr:response regulator transcription factor [Paenibacillus zeisoli]RUT36322.1 response regulator transcription factor [Paenibacillus zeisoli]